jgi:hypothetical protein
MIRNLSLGVALAAVTAAVMPSLAAEPIKARARGGATPSWSKGIQPISRESYDNAIECGKQGGQDPPCVFWDTGFCKNVEFELTFSTAYKSVAYAVWTAVRQQQPAPTPDYAEAQRTRVTVAVKALDTKNNPVVDVHIKRGGKIVQPLARAPAGVETRYTFDYPGWAAGTDIDLEIVGKRRPVLCRIDKGVLAQMR